MVSPATIKIRAKKLGVLIRDARLAAHISPTDCAQALDVSEDVYAAYENGNTSPSLPEMEMLAYFLQTPLEHFLGRETLSSERKAKDKLDPQVVLGLRQRIIGAKLRKARLESGIDLETLAESTGLDPNDLEAYEMGQKSVPLPELDLIAVGLGYSVRHFQDQHGPLGAWFAEQKALQDFRDLPAEIKAFVCKPVNRPYLELAQRLSEMEVSKLRSVAEGLLEITL